MKTEDKKPVVSKEDIKKGLRKLGLKKGYIIGVHSSLSSLGYVEGGADAVIDALLEVVGEEGTIVMPTHSTNLAEVKRSPEEKSMGVAWLYKILPYDLEKNTMHNWGHTGNLQETKRSPTKRKPSPFSRGDRTQS